MRERSDQRKEGLLALNRLASLAPAAREHLPDLVIERGDGAVVAFEVKAAARVPGDDMRALRKLREASGETFIAGVAFYTGTRTYRFEDRAWVMPIDRLWLPIGREGR